MKKVIGCKVFGNWGVSGWDYGVIVNQFTDSYGTDIVIEWEDGRQKQVDLKEIVEINDETDIHSVGIFLDTKGTYLSTDENISNTNDKEESSKDYVESKINNYSAYGDTDKLRSLIACLVDIQLPMYGHRSLSQFEEERVKTIFFKELDEYGVSITSSMLSRAKRLKWNKIASLLSEYIDAHKAVS